MNRGGIIKLRHTSELYFVEGADEKWGDVTRKTWTNYFRYIFKAEMILDWSRKCSTSYTKKKETYKWSDDKDNKRHKKNRNWRRNGIE